MSWDDSNFDYTDAYWENQDGSMGDTVLSPRAQASFDAWAARKDAAEAVEPDGMTAADRQWADFVAEYFG